ncbi:MAG: aminoacyl-tRNA hydrolase [Pleurocapsa minor GSE-CHR-MK-17-07R]|jgi:PTH1 family peptidyl-tRNA hydrolase|nr:aminoacyl-tRNA hydrolase [Pleurocapsa minor GSE-CHR-MK 17-07R]
MTELFLIVGLGNPGQKYAETRHNVGFRAVEAFAQKHGLTFSKTEHRAQVASGAAMGQRVLLAKPQTFMNVSGDSVGPLAGFYKIPPERIVVVADDLDIPLGTLRIRRNGSSGGQNGLKHILQRMGTQDIARVRIGIGRPPGRQDPADYVLAPFRGDDAILAAQVQDKAVEALEIWLTHGIDTAMTRCNGVVGEAKPTSPMKKQSAAPPASDPPTNTPN